MATARVSGIASGVTLQARSTAGEWRDLAENDEISDGEEILARADQGQFNLNAYQLADRVGGVWTVAQTITLHIPDGTGTYRQDRFAVEGDGTESASSLVVTVDKGQIILRDMHAALVHMQRTQGGRFRYPEINGTRYLGILEDLELGTTLGEGGFDAEHRGTIICDKSQFASGHSFRQGGKILWQDGRKLKINRVTEDEISFGLEVQQVTK